MSNRAVLWQYVPALMLAALLCITAVSCGGTQPVSPPLADIAQALRNADSERALWGVWEMNIGPDGYFEVRPVHSGAPHVNVIPFLLPPSCSDCLSVQGTGYFPAENRVEADVTIKNPTDLYGYDVRGILMSDIGHDVYNADDYTELWDNGGPVTRNPFKRFPADPGPYIFNPQDSHTVHYSVRIPIPPQWNQILMAVDASWPNPCGEPFNIGAASKTVWGELTEEGGMVHCYVDVLSHYSPVESVVLDMSAIGGGEVELDPWDNIPGLANYFAASDIPFAGFAPGDYELWISAKVSGLNNLLYDKVHVTIETGGEPVPRPTVIDILDYPFSASSIEVKDGLLYAIGAEGLKIYSTGAQGQLTLHGEVATPVFDTDRYELFLGDSLAFAYLERWEYLESKILVFDISNPVNPVHTGTMQTVPILGGAVVKDSYLICSVPGWKKIATVDATDHASPHFAADYTMTDTPWAVALDGNNLFVVREGKGIGVYSVTNPLSVSPKGNMGWNKITNSALVVSNQRGYMWSSTGELGIFSYTNPLYPSLISSTVMKKEWTGDTVTGFKIAGSYLYAHGETAYVIKVSDASNPLLVFEPTVAAISPTTTMDFAPAGRYGYAPRDEEIELIRNY